MFSSSFTGKSRGVAILINRHLPLSDVQTISDKSGRYVMLKGCLHGQVVSFLNIYFPPIQSNDFISHVFSKFADWIVDNTVIAGDFNCYFSSMMDRSPPVQSPMSKRAKAISDTCIELGLVDACRVLHSNDKEFTFYSTVHKSSSRIDFLLTPKMSTLILSAVVLGILYQTMRPLLLV